MATQVLKLHWQLIIIMHQRRIVNCVYHVHFSGYNNNTIKRIFEFV